MLRTLTCLVFLIFAFNFGQDLSNEIKSMVSAEPSIHNQKLANDEIQDFINFDNDIEEEVLVRVKRSPDPNPQPRGVRGGGSRGGSRGDSRGRSRNRGGSGGYLDESGGSGGISNLSIGEVLGITFGVIFGAGAIIMIVVFLCW
uniref:Cnidarian restricted protein n=1 Tax=Clytia hemisphaerica TaxID=252671 RepID=A0A7M5WYL2_9CNID